MTCAHHLCMKYIISAHIFYNTVYLLYFCTEKWYLMLLSPSWRVISSKLKRSRSRSYHSKDPNQQVPHFIQVWWSLLYISSAILLFAVCICIWRQTLILIPLAIFIEFKLQSSREKPILSVFYCFQCCLFLAESNHRVVELMTWTTTIHEWINQFDFISGGQLKPCI